MLKLAKLIAMVWRRAFYGRLGRDVFWRQALLTFLLLAVLGFLLGFLSNGPILVRVKTMIFLILGLSLLSAAVKRHNDIGPSDSIFSFWRPMTAMFFVLIVVISGFTIGNFETISRDTVAVFQALAPFARVLLMMSIFVFVLVPMVRMIWRLCKPSALSAEGDRTVQVGEGIK